MTCARRLVLLAKLVAGLAAVVVGGGCAGDYAGDLPDGGMCGVSISFSPVAPVAGPSSEVRVTSFVSNAAGVRTYDWRVTHAGSTVAHDDAQADGSQITFLAPTVGTYEVTLDVSVPGVYCPQVRETVNVTDGSGETFAVRLHVVPPVGIDAPPIDRVLVIPFDADYELGPVVLDPGSILAGTVASGGAGVPAYLRFSPLGMDDALVEAYADAEGAFTARLVNQIHQVLVVPADNTLAPARLTWSPGVTTLAVDAGSPITGTVRGPSGTGLANAKVQLTIDGVPTTLATTSATGAFTVRGTPIAGADVKVMMTPPAGSGLPRLEAISSSFSLTQPLLIEYDAGVAVRNVGGMQVIRGGQAVAGAKVTLVGAIAAIGTVTAGLAVNATGFVRTTAIANGSGVLPTTFTLAAPVSAVVEVPTVPGTPTDLAVTALDLTGAPPASVVAAAPQDFVTAAAVDLDPLAGARVDLVPAGALALAGTPTLHLATDASGALAAALASGGEYDAHWFDPAGRAGSDVVQGVTAATMPARFDLPPALQLSGTLSVTGNPNKLVGASVQVLCAGCSGIERDRPFAEVASDQLGDFQLAVPHRGPR